jgi:phosphate transport system protein
LRDLSITEVKRDAALAINEMEVNIENECLSVLARHQSVAIDLRCIIVVLKANNDLERKGDLATSIAEQVSFIKEGALSGTSRNILIRALSIYGR